MSAALVGLADAVVASLNAAPGGTFSQSFTAVRTFRPKYDLKELDETRVTVVPRGEGGQLASRCTSQHDYQIDVGVHRRLADQSNASVDPYLLLLEQLTDYFRFRRPTGRSESLIAFDYLTRWSEEHLHQAHVFLGVAQLVFRNHRE